MDYEYHSIRYGTHQLKSGLDLDEAIQEVLTSYEMGLDYPQKITSEGVTVWEVNNPMFDLKTLTLDNKFDPSRFIFCDWFED